MNITAGELARRWVPNWSRLARLQRSEPLRAFLGANLIAVVVIAIRAQSWLQPVELVIYDALRVAWAGNQPMRCALEENMSYSLLGGTRSRTHARRTGADNDDVVSAATGSLPSSAVGTSRAFAPGNSPSRRSR